MFGREQIRDLSKEAAIELVCACQVKRQGAAIGERSSQAQ